MASPTGRAASETGGRLERDSAHRDGIDVTVHFQDKRFGPVPLDDQGRVDRRQHVSVEAYVHDSASNRYDCAHRRDRIHKTSNGSIRIQDEAGIT